MATTVDSRRETVSLIGSDKVEGTARWPMHLWLNRHPRLGRHDETGNTATSTRTTLIR